MVSFTASTLLVAGLGLCLSTTSAAPAARAPADATRCVDDAVWSGGKKGKHCSWLAGRKPKQIEKACRSKKFMSKCPATCGLCPTVFTFTSKAPTVAPAACDTAVNEVAKTLGEVQQDQFVALGGRPLPNFESPAVAYAHVEHCKGVVADGKPRPTGADGDEMSAMHFEHCRGVVDKVQSELDGQDFDIGKDVCARKFPYWAVATLIYDIVSSDMFDYGFNYGFNYRRGRSTREDGGKLSERPTNNRPTDIDGGKPTDRPADADATRPTVMPMNAIAAENFAAVLMKQFRRDKLTESEEQYLKMMEGEAAVELSALAYRCQH